MDEWYYKRNAVNRYFASLGYTNINVNRKPWCEGPYGRETQSVQLHKPNHRNWLTTDATARLLTEIVTGQAVSAKRCAEMLELLHRDPSPDVRQQERSGPRLHRPGPAARLEALVQGRLDQRMPPRCRLRRTAQRREVRPGDLHHGPRRRPRHHPHHCQADRRSFLDRTLSLPARKVGRASPLGPYGAIRR